VKAAALHEGMRVYEPASLHEFARQIAQSPFDLFVLASYGRILPQSLLDLPRLGALNVHPSLLPSYRGATPIQAALANGDSETGVTIMRMDCGMDTGEIVLQERVAIAAGETYGELHDRLAMIGADLLGAAIEMAQAGRLTTTPQRGEATVTRPLSKADLTVDLTWPPQRIVDKVRALAPQPGARAILDGENVKILRAHVSDDGTLAIDELVAPNRGKMTGDEYRRLRAARA